MELLIVDFVRENYTPEVQSLLVKAMELADDFQVDGVTQDVLGLLGSYQSRAPEDTVDAVREAYELSIRQILKAHAIETDEELDFTVGVEIVDMLARLHDLEDYEPTVVALNSMASDLEQFTKLCVLHTQLVEIDVLQNIVSVAPESIKAIKDYAEGMLEKRQEEPTDEKLYRQKLKKFLVVKPGNWVGFQLVEAGMGMGLSIDIYLAYGAAGFEKKDVETMAGNIMSLLLLGSESAKDPFLYFRENADKFTINLQESAVIANRIAGWLAEMSKVKLT